MTNPTLKAAFDRLNTAIGRLDAASANAALRQSLEGDSQAQANAELVSEWEQKLAANESELIAVREENDFLKNDNLRLGNQLQELQQEHLELQRAAGGIVQRLDGSIKQLDMILEH
ncbi:MAG: hypothetical protein J0M34_00315 [Alphaproteobacteria bacterium]|nr:hypothetical protein [Alphaproteobacteria bacterium]